jgi:hypothetical protein
MIRIPPAPTVLISALALSLGCSRHIGPTRADNLCLTNLATLSVRLQTPLAPWSPNGESFPSTLQQLVTPKTPLSVFVCPATGHKPGPSTNIEQWTDYIYFASQKQLLMNIPLVICPPENHGGKFGHVLWQHIGRDRLPPDQIRALIENPWNMAANDPLDDVLVVRVPQRLQRIYTNAYTPPASSPKP